MYGILCATPEELAALQARLGVTSQPGVYGPTQVWTGTHEGADFALALAGMGKVNAAAAATLLLSVFHADTLIFAGVAGGLNPALGVGSVLLAQRLDIHDYGHVFEGAFTPTRSGAMPIGADRLTGLTPVAAPIATNLAKLRDAVAGELGHPIALGGVITADYFLNCAVTRDQLHAAFAADAIDMESGAVDQVALAWGRPLYVIRTLSDLAGAEGHTSYLEMARMAADNSALCVPALLAILADSA
ncbi:5'-methylthioadenosine/S-adenosylhomocysteine nucleosidase [Phenylobacterium sp.]|uniref:5'-methylthioadenosine/S-adenosylhomocysteine nucleosidase n=1 Tax=Phenylobacterium sp. TaxID=1871053 RepID=UPI0030F45B01